MRFSHRRRLQLPALSAATAIEGFIGPSQNFRLFFKAGVVHLLNCSSIHKIHRKRSTYYYAYDICKTYFSRQRNSAQKFSIYGANTAVTYRKCIMEV